MSLRNNILELDMAKCNTCGTEISFLNYERECDSCAEIRVNQWRVRQTARTNLKNAEISEQSKAINENKAEQSKRGFV